MLDDIDLATLRDFLEEDAIRKCLARYCRAVDRGDGELLRTVYWPDATDDHGTVNGNLNELVEHIIGHGSKSDLMFHTLGTMIIDLDGDEAKVETYFFAYNRYSVSDDKMGELFLGGRYLDRMQKRGGAWRIAKRKVQYDWFKQTDDAYDFKAPIAGFSPKSGQGNVGDALYAWLGIAR